MKEVLPPPSISGPKVLSYWLKAIGGYFLASLSAVSALVAILRWYSIPPQSDELLPRLIASAVWAVLSSTAIAFLIRLTLDYRRRYHLHRDRGLVRDLYPDRQRLIQHYGDVMRDSKKKFRVMGISLHTLMTDSALENNLRQALTASTELEVSFILLSPYSSSVRQRERVEGRAAGRISSDCLQNYHRALDVKTRLGTIGSRFHVYQIDTIPVGFILQRDDEIYFEPYLDKSVGRTCPTFVLRKNEFNEIAFNKFVEHIEASVKPEYEQPQNSACPHKMVTPYGNQSSRLNLRNAVFLDRDGVLLSIT